MATTVIMYAPGVKEVHLQVDRTKDRLVADILADMRRYVPVLTGALRSTIREDRGTPVTRIWAGDESAGVDYAAYQEFGTSKMAAQPFMRPAVYQYRRP